MFGMEKKLKRRRQLQRAQEARAYIPSEATDKCSLLSSLVSGIGDVSLFVAVVGTSVPAIMMMILASGIFPFDTDAADMTTAVNIFTFFAPLLLVISVYYYYAGRFDDDYARYMLRAKGLYNSNADYRKYLDKTNDPEDRIQRAEIFWPLHDEINELGALREKLAKAITEIESLGTQDQAEYAQLKQLLHESNKRHTELSEVMQKMVSDDDFTRRMKQLKSLDKANNLIASAQAKLASDQSSSVQDAITLVHLDDHPESFAKIMQEIQQESG
jgi:hypothetical protein